MFRASRWGLLMGVGAALGMVVHTLRRRRATLRDHAVQDERVTEASDESFPASDPPSHTPTVGSQVAS